MRVRSFGLAVLTGVMLSAPMIAVMYLADRWLGLSFPLSTRSTGWPASFRGR